MYEQYKYEVKNIESNCPRPWSAMVGINSQYVSHRQPSVNPMTMAPGQAPINQEHTGSQSLVDAAITRFSTAPIIPTSSSTERLDPTFSVVQSQGNSIRRTQSSQSTNPATKPMAKTSTIIANSRSQRHLNSVRGDFSQGLEHLDIFREGISDRMRQLLKGSVEDETSPTNAGVIGEGRPWPRSNSNKRDR